VALAVLAVLPLVTTALLYRRALPVDARAPAFMDIPGTIAPSWTASAVQRTAWLSWLQMWVLPVWSVGVLLFCVRFACGCQHARALGRRGEGADESVLSIVGRLSKRMKVDRPLRVMTSSIADGPSVVGWLRPVILLPTATLLGLAPAQLEAVLAHELAHIRRHDYLVNVLQMLVETTLFYHPAVWWTSQRIRLERELCCDDLAVRSCGDALSYARALMTLEKLRVTAPSLAMGIESALLPRIQRLLGAPAREAEPWRVLGVFAMCAALTCCALSLSDVHVQAHGVSIDRPSHTDTAVVTGAPGVMAPSIEDWARVQLHVVVDAAQSERRSAGPLPSNWSCVDGSEMLCGPPSVLQEFERDRKEHDQTQDTRYVLDPAMAQPLRLEYPRHLREARVEGTVALEGRIGTDGFLTGFQVRASGDPDFEKAAIAAIRRWEWDPARVNGVAVDVPITLTIEFKIES
jgi:TonB family protein